jgi:hypothetical protein
MNMSKKSIAELAYELWEARGCPHGSSEQDWLEAERLTAGSVAGAHRGSKNDDEASIESFPASDPPASHMPDVPPSNAEEKWAADRSESANRESPQRRTPRQGT